MWKEQRRWSWAFPAQVALQEELGQGVVSQQVPGELEEVRRKHKDGMIVTTITEFTEF